MDSTKSGSSPSWKAGAQSLEIFAPVAERLLAEIGPKRVLVVGRAKAFLVEALRGRGVEAFGIDLSEAASGEVPDKDDFNNHYDLVVCMASIERLGDDGGGRIIANICRSTGDALFSSTPEDLEETTHVTVRPRSFWVERFAEQGFSLDVNYDASFIASHAMRFLRKKAGESLIDGLLDQRDLMRSQLEALQISVSETNKLLAEKDMEIAGLSFDIHEFQQSMGWKILQRIQRVRGRLLPPGTRRLRGYRACRRFLKIFLDEGLWRCFQRSSYTQQRLQNIAVYRDLQYQIWLRHHSLSYYAVARMKASAKRLRYTPIISVITPIYNPEEAWLRRAIESVRAQIYPHWELCIVDDGSDKPHVRTVLNDYAKDPRIRITHLPSNEGIACASNHALSLAMGEFVGFLDHDDELSPDALFEVVTRLNENPALDLLYSDEDKLETDGRRIEPFFKPDWSPDLLLSTNYIAHFSVFRRSLLEEVGGFRVGLDGSQDYDLLLRFTERTQKIAHIPKVLYHWRKTSASVASATAARPFALKPFAYAAARRAVEQALQRRGYEGRVEMGHPGIYMIRYRLKEAPLVSIIIPTRDQWQLLQQCLRSIEEKTSYTRYEIIVLDNDSTDSETLRYFDTIAAKWPVYRYPGPFNFSAVNNFGVAKAGGDYLVFLNNDTRVIRPDWLTAMLERAQHPEVGAVGAKLLYPAGRIQHAGVVMGIGGLAAHAFRNLPDGQSYFDFADLMRNCSAVTAACMMVRRRVFEEMGGFDERFRVAFNDVDFCLRLRQRGYLIVYHPLALLYHYEYATRGRYHPSEDEELLCKLWGHVIRQGDPYYNPNLTLSREDWSLDL